MMMADRLFFAAMVFIPLFITVTAGYALRYEKLDTVPVAAVDEDGSGYSGLLLERLSGKYGISVNVTDRENALAMLKNNEVEQAFIIRRRFESAVKAGENCGLIELYSSPSSYSVGFVREVVAAEAMRLITANMAANNVLDKYDEMGIEKESGFKDEIYAYADALWEPKPLLTVDYRELAAGVAEPAPQTSFPAFSASSAGLIVAFIMFYTLFAAGWLIEERLNGTIKRLGAAKGAVAVSFQGSVLALLLAGILQIVIFTTVLKIFFGVILFSGLLSYMVLLAYLLSVIAVGMFLSSVLKTQAQLQAGAPVLALMTGFAGGCFWNFVEMPERIRDLSLLTPQGWALKALNGLVSNPADLSFAIVPLTVLFMVSLILLPVSYIIIHIQLRQG